MTSALLRRSSSTFSRCFFAAITSVESLPHHHHFHSSSSFPRRNGVSDEGARAFHAKPGPLNFHYSLASRAALPEWSTITSTTMKLFAVRTAKKDWRSRTLVSLGRSWMLWLRKGSRSPSPFRQGRHPLALVLAPTRELARQVEKEFKEVAPNMETICLYGGIPISQQMRQLDYGVDVAVGTPGRIIDLLNRGSLKLKDVQFVVLDEADQMLQVGFQEEVEKILEKLPSNRQTLMFSATMPAWIKNITRNYLNNPLIIDLVGDSDQKLADGISLYSVASNAYAKAGILAPLITEHAKGGKCIVFTQTKRDADRLSYAMAKSLKCEALHGDISQTQRERTLAGFRNNHFNVLVATDVASRGLDIPNVDLVIHYDLPNSSEIFVHRSGRTGRAGKKGTAILVYTDD